MENASLPLNPDGTVPSTDQEGVKRTTAEGDTWIDSVAGFFFDFWDDTLGSQSASEAQQNQAITSQPMEVNEEPQPAEATSEE